MTNDSVSMPVDGGMKPQLFTHKGVLFSTVPPAVFEVHAANGPMSSHFGYVHPAGQGCLHALILPLRNDSRVRNAITIFAI
ncbi:hypothetical protein KIN20_023293 [Parelaphostrongylus tenuis]|uniref:Uncharacterized protein n=1 Tax=Parelaphostrongylus tenuis TaxID=148309 RepID=A0AAD5N9Z5_PARTN|nr:hypothetical protein KIN20_023293 [Parelaphostrongylus tenuis]